MSKVIENLFKASNHDSDQGKARSYGQKIAKILAIVVVIVGILVTIGWVLDIGTLKSISPNWVTMKLSTAVSFIFSGVTLYFITRIQEGKSAAAQVALPASGLIIFLFMITLLVSVFAGIRTGIEDLFIKETGEAVETTTPGRPSVATIINFILIITTCIFALSDSTKFKKSLSWIGAIVAAVGGLSVVGYAVNSPVLYYSIEDVSTAMALHTSILFVMLGVGLILLPTRQEPERAEYMKLRTKLISLFWIVSIIPIIFVGTLSYSVARDLTSTGTLGNSILIIGAVTAVTIGIFGFLISKSITKPIMRLRDAANEISRGNLDFDVNIKSNDEVGHLASKFDAMRQNIQMRTKMLEDTNAKLLQNEQKLQRAHEQLIEADKAKGEFSAMISHELKTPLVPIRTYSELLLDGTLGELSEKQKEKLQILYDNAVRLSNLIQDILDIYKLELGKMKFNMQAVSVKEIIDVCVNAFMLTARGKGIALESVIQEDAKLKCDASRIIQVLNNLVSNAIKFVPQHTGRIEISAGSDGNSVVFSVKDNGIGIPKEKQENLFKKFYQVDTSLGRRVGGTGLGLAIAKGIVEAHNGKIWVESEERKGSIFSFSIPEEVRIN